MSLDRVTPVLDGDDSQPSRPRMPVLWSPGGASQLTFAPDLRIGDWLVQPSLDRISRDGADVRLRPQVMNMLVCLARGRGRTVSREQIFSAVWPDQSVADTNIARCVAELRKALGDRVQAPAVIETIPKRGYRLIAPVTFVTDTGCARPSPCPVPGTTQPEAGDAAARLAADVAPGAVAGRNATVQRATETSQPAAEPSLSGAAHDPVTAAVALPRIRRRLAAGFVWVAGLVAAVAAVLWPPASR